MKNVYLLSLFYAKALDHKAAFARIGGIVSTVSSGDFKRIESGVSQTCIAFTSDLSEEELRTRLNPILQEGLTALVTQVAAVPATNIAVAVLQWFHARLGNRS